ncbi:MAG TPA: response regulator [Ktedonobacterales bacterium]|nr:response regulator [Ktedonobacterales bacterium]
MTAGALPAYTVLIVDDDPDLLQLLTDGLELLGNFRVVQAADGIAGLEQYFEVQPDCMIIDVKMPGLDGYQLVRALRGDPASAETPLIMLTALAQEQQQFAGLALGADQYLIKPVTPRELVAAVKRALLIGEEDRRARMQSLLAQSEEAEIEHIASHTQEAFSEQED